MTRGRVKWFNEVKGYGFIETEHGDEVFFHFSKIDMEGYKFLPPGAPVELEFIDGEMGYMATIVRKIDAGEESTVRPHSLPEHQSRRNALQRLLRK